jgi:carbonic anhydrase/acetyltransferase-like protein (isoleucine patch superfamily)
MSIRSFRGAQPQIDPSAYIAPGAQVIGDVAVGAGSSIWFNAVLRGDVNAIHVGEQTNIQDLCCLHVTHEHPLSVGSRVTVGHGVTLHGCAIGDRCLIGMGAIVLDGAVVGEGSLIAAGALVPPGMHVPPGSMAVGSPAKVRRPMSSEEQEAIALSSEHYAQYARQHREESHEL